MYTRNSLREDVITSQHTLLYIIDLKPTCSIVLILVLFHNRHLIVTFNTLDQEIGIKKPYPNLNKIQAAKHNV